MAKVTAPLFGFTASGKLADALCFFRWKGIDCARKYVVPNNPQTADQTTQRNAFTSCVSAWRNYFTVAQGRTAWNRTATVGPKPMSGFNAFIAAAVQIITGDADASFASTCTAASSEAVTWAMLNLDDGGQGDESGDFEVWVGDSPDSLLYLETKTIIAGYVLSSDLGDVDDIKYVKLRKDSQDRSGISKITLIA